MSICSSPNQTDARVLRLVLQRLLWQRDNDISFAIAQQK